MNQQWFLEHQETFIDITWYRFSPRSKLRSVPPINDRTRSSASWCELLKGSGLGSLGCGVLTDGAADEDIPLGDGADVPPNLASSACSRAISSSFSFSTEARSLRSRSSSLSSAANCSFSRFFSVSNSRLISCSRCRICSSSSLLFRASSLRCSASFLLLSSSRSSRVCRRSSTRCRLGGSARNHIDHGSADLPTANTKRNKMRVNGG